MGYGTPMQNQNKGYAAQEKKDLMKMPGDFKQMSKGSFMSKHISSPLAMGKAHSMAPKMESPMEKELVGGQKNLPEGLKKAIEASPAKHVIAHSHGKNQKEGKLKPKSGYYDDLSNKNSYYYDYNEG